MSMDRERERSASPNLLALHERWSTKRRHARKWARKHASACERSDHAKALASQNRDAEQSVLEELAAWPARSLDDLLCKAAIAARLAGDGDDPTLAAKIRDRLGEIGSPPIALVWSIVRDLVAMLPREDRR